MSQCARNSDLNNDPKNPDAFNPFAEKALVHPCSTLDRYNNGISPINKTFSGLPIHKNARFGLDDKKNEVLQPQAKRALAVFWHVLL